MFRNFSCYFRCIFYHHLAADSLLGRLSMPGNEVGDRIHNFFAQENLSQGQHHSEIVDGSWTGISDNSWVGGQRQIGTPSICNLKNQSGQQSGMYHAH